MMIDNIVLATDGSEHANKALDMAASIAAAFGSKLTIVHVLMHGIPPEELQHMAQVEHLVEHATSTMPAMTNLPTSMVHVFQNAKNWDIAAKVVTAIGDKIVDTAAHKARDFGAKDVETCVTNGDYARSILDAAKKAEASMIIMGSRGLGDLQGLLMGSVSHKVAQLADCTVVSVK